MKIQGSSVGDITTKPKRTVQAKLSSYLKSYTHIQDARDETFLSAHVKTKAHVSTFSMEREYKVHVHTSLCKFITHTCIQCTCNHCLYINMDMQTLAQHDTDTQHTQIVVLLQTVSTICYLPLHACRPEGGKDRE